ncbi:UBX domain-containing protein 4 [Procambarus clarkii]|uniref:UBX domain-containing protein 4 n=1 Tax=Procambarus clarkii TaxID=6728 RepID=UPI003742FD30
MVTDSILVRSAPTQLQARMKWFEGSIPEAIGAAKSRNAIFVVYVHDSSEASKSTDEALGQKDISSVLGSDKFVAIQLENGTEGAKQFSQIYPLVLVPSLFFISGQTGIPLEVLGGPLNVENLRHKLDSLVPSLEQVSINFFYLVYNLYFRENMMYAQGILPLLYNPFLLHIPVLGLCLCPMILKYYIFRLLQASQDGSSQDTSSCEVSQSIISSDLKEEHQDELQAAGGMLENSVNTPTGEPGLPSVSENEALVESNDTNENVQSAEDIGATGFENGSSSETSTEQSIEEKVERAKFILAQKQAKLAQEKADDEKRKEIERRKMGQEIAKKKQEQEDEMLRASVRERKKDKEEERLARERVKAQIAADRAEREARAALLHGEQPSSQGSSSTCPRAVGSLSFKEATMSDASSTSSHSTISRGNTKRLSEEEIRDMLYDDGAMDDDLDYDPEKDLTQRSDTSEGETEVEDVMNRYAHSLIDTGILPASRMTQWKDTTNDEMYVFLALSMMMKPSEKHIIQAYWSKDSLVPSPMFNSNISRLKFRLPDGSSSIAQFPAEATLSEVLLHIQQNVQLPFSSFSLGSTVHSGPFTPEDYNSSLRDLGLVPSAIMVVLPTSSRGSGTLAPSGGIWDLLWILLSPITFLFGIVSQFLNGREPRTPPPSPDEPEAKRSREDSSGSNQQRPTTAYRRRGDTRLRQEGNIHRLGNDDDDDDENNTWNGNSTQQM